MNNDAIYDYILQHPGNYPGKHLQSQPRTQTFHKPLESKAQFHIIISALSKYLEEKMVGGKGVNLKNFGAFAFEVDTGKVAPAQYTQFNVQRGLDEQRQERKHIHRVRPCFQPDSNFQYQLTRYHNKEEMTKPSSQNSIYQKGFQMCFCNPEPIAAACFLARDVVKSAIDAFSTAIVHLTTANHSLNINLGFLKLQVNRKALSYQYSPATVQAVNEVHYQFKVLLLPYSRCVRVTPTPNSTGKTATRPSGTRAKCPPCSRNRTMRWSKITSKRLSLLRSCLWTLTPLNKCLTPSLSCPLSRSRRLDHISLLYHYINY